jgi:hypothetical protein
LDEKLAAHWRNEVAFMSIQPSRMAANSWTCRVKIAKDAQLWGASRQLIVRHMWKEREKLLSRCMCGGVLGKP